MIAGLDLIKVCRQKMVLEELVARVTVPVLALRAEEPMIDICSAFTAGPQRTFDEG